MLFSLLFLTCPVVQKYHVHTHISVFLTTLFIIFYNFHTYQLLLIKQISVRIEVQGESCYQVDKKSSECAHTRESIHIDNIYPATYVYLASVVSGILNSLKILQHIDDTEISTSLETDVCVVHICTCMQVSAAYADALKKTDTKYTPTYIFLSERNEPAIDSTEFRARLAICI